MIKQNFLKSILCLLVGIVCNVAWAQAVIFPQAQQPGTASVSEVDGGYAIGNDLFTAKFLKTDGKITFGGSEQLGLIAGSEIFKVQLQDGTEIPASEFTLGEVVTETLTGNNGAVKGAHRFNGVQLKAQFTHTSGLAVEWRAVLRDGSHYLRTEMDIKNAGSAGINMSSITPMIYTVQNVDGEKAPVVVGNTRGAVIASDKIFAGVETPTAYNMAGESTDLESFVFKAWDGASSWAWTPEENEIPEGIKSLSQYAVGAVNASRGYLIFRETGDYTITLDYTSGSNRLQILGVDILDVNGNVVDTDYHFGFTGGSDSNRDYTVTVSKVGAYMLRIFVTNAGSGEGYNSVGTITYSKKVTLPELVYDLASTQTPSVSPEVKEPEKLPVITPEAGTLTALQAKQTQWTSGLSQFTNWTKAIPEGMSTPTASAIYLDKHYTIEAGNLSVKFAYTTGSHGLNVLGVQLIDAQGVVTSEYKNGFTGTNTTTTYSLVVPSTGDYIVRMFVDKKSDGVNGNGNIDFTLTEFTYNKIGTEAEAADTWTSAWTGFANWTGTLPDGTTATGTAKYIEKTYLIDAGKLSVLFDYTSGNHGLYILGVQVFDYKGKVVSSEFKNGFTGSNSTVTYTVNVPKAGLYTVRYITDYRSSDGSNTNGNITLSLAELEAVEVDVLGTIGEDETLPDAWTPSDWKTIDSEKIPNRINEVGCTDENARVIEQQITITSAGVLSVEFLYASGNARLNMVGVDLLDETGNVAVDDYHAGYTGNEKNANIYKLNVFSPGTYTIRYFADNSENINSTGNINLKLTVDYTLHLVAPSTTPIMGKWSRLTTLKVAETWNVSSVVGIIAPGQARRSFLAYSERERAVPWRAVPAYISWYELNIDRNNAAPGHEHENFTEDDCLPILREWKTQLYDKYREAPYAFVWDDGWDTYGEWQFHSGFPQGFTNMDNIGREMGAGQGAWLGPVGGYGTSGGYRRNYWSSKGGMQLSNPSYYKVFVNAVTGLLKDKGYDFRFFKFDGISDDFSALGPDKDGDPNVANENAEAIIMAEKVLRGIKEDVFLNTTVGTWASPFWFQHTDAVWRQEKDYGEIGNNSNDRENWITYRDRLVYQNFVQNSPLCPINTLMTHGFIFTKFSEPASTSRDWNAVVRELRCAFACGSGMVELYNDYKLTNELVNPATGNAGELWGEIAKCMQWQRKNADVLPDIHWVGGNPWTGSKAEVYGWAAWNGKKAVLTLRNGANDAQEFKFTLREVLEIPEYITSSTITFTKAFDDQAVLAGFAEGEQINIDEEITVTLPGSSLYVFDGSEKTVKVESISLSTENDVTEVPANKTLKVNAVVTPADANQSLTWTSSKTEVATVANGIITPVKEGEVTITATAKDGSGVSKSITITVTPRVYTLAVLGTDNNGAGASYGDKQYANGASLAMDFDLSELHANAIDGMMAMVNVVDETIYISYMPANTQFYTIKNGHGGYVSLAPDYCDEDGYLKLTNSSSIKDRRGLWAFVGNSTDGYKIYNYTTGLSKVLGITGSEADARATMIAEGAEGYTTVFDGSIKLDGTDGRIKLKGSTNNYWNKRGNYLALWNDNAATGNDTGSQFFMTAVDFNDFVDMILPITPETKEELAADKIQGVASFEPTNANTLWYKTSAMAAGVDNPWMEYALPLGNGELGCMVYGGVLKEEIQFNEKTLWTGPVNVIGAASGNRTYTNFGSVFVKNLDETLSNGVTDYVRYLDIEEGIAGVQFTANGTKHSRKYLSSAPDQVIAAQYKSENGTMHLLFKLEAEPDIEATYIRNDANVVYENGMASFTGYMESVNYAARLHVEADDDAEIITTDGGIEVKNATEVTFYLKGATNFDGDVEHINNYFTAETPADVDARVKGEIETAAAKGFDAIETAHVEDFEELTGRMTLDLGLATPTVDTKTLVDNYYPNNGDGTSTANDHLFLEQLYFNYGRYLAIGSNRKDIAAPNNLQGLWNDRGSDSPWNSDVHTNINVQMNYWPTEITNLSDLHVPFLNFIIRGAQGDGWKQVAERFNDGIGWATLTETSLYHSMSTFASQYLVANVWYTSHLWTHYRYTQDKEFLAQAFPVMWSAAEFWFHRLIEDRGFPIRPSAEEEEALLQQNPNYKHEYTFNPDGSYVAPNEYSAEQDGHPREDATAHSQQLVSYLLQNLCDAIEILGRENVPLTDAQIADLYEKNEKIDKGLHTEVYDGAWGETYNGVKTGDVLLREWKYSPYSVGEPGHRHLSHLMALFPLDQITPESEYFIPAVNALKHRGDAATGWSMGWKVNLWARALDGDHAHLIIKNALKHSTSYGTNAGAGGIYYNLFDAHAPFQIDGNFGVCSGMAEMLLQSAHGYINILPALPAVWEKTGAVTGMKAMGNFTVSFNWQNGKAQQATIVSHKGAPLKVRSARGNIAEAYITVNGAEVIAEVDENGIATIPNVKENDEVVIDFTKRHSVAVKVYTPGARVSTLEPGKKYFIYNTAFNGNEDRTGFLFDNGAGMGHTKKKPFGDNILKTTNEAYLWEVEATDEAGKYYIKAADGGYVNASGKTDNAEAQVLYIQPWNTSTATKAGVKSEGADGAVVENANIGSDVFTISGTKVGNTDKDCWNGNAGSFAKWSSAHPYAFHEVSEDAVLLSDAFPLPGHTYYIYCDNDTRQYFYNDGGTLKVSEKRTEWSNEYLFTCSFDGTYFQFKNAKGKYLKHQGLQDAAHNFELAEYLDGVNLKTPGGKYFVMKNDNTFSQADRGDYNPASTDFSTVYKFEEFLFPVDGETYYIYSDTYHDDEYVNRYMYADGSNLKLNTSLSVTDAYKWTCKVTDDGYVQFQNGEGKYLAHKGIQDAPYNFTLNKYNANHAIAATLYSVADSRYFVVKNSDGAFNQADKTYNQTTEDYCTDFVFMPVNDVKVLTVKGSTKTDDATATWNGETKALPASWVITPQTVITDATLRINGGNNFTFTGLYDGTTSLGETTEIESIDGNLTLTAKLTPSFFSASTAENDLVPVRIRNVRNGEYTLRLNASDNYTGKAVNSGKTAYGENEIWYLVGTEESFKIYNRVAGTGLHMVLAGTGGGSAASMNTTADNADFCLVTKDNGYAICPKANTGQSFNMHGGAGADIKLYGAGDGGSIWVVEKMDVNNPITLNVVVDKVWESSPRVAELTFTIDGQAGQTRILGSVEGQKLYIPLGATYEVSSETYRGYTYNDYTENDGVITVSYTANDERTLFYSPRDGHPYRIPAIATAPNGDIFAICDYRPCGNDIGYGEVDLVCRVSSDNGVTWTEERTIADGLGHINDGIWKMGFGDPAIVADRESNKVLVMSVCGNRTCWDGNYGEGGENENPNRVSRLYITYDEDKQEWVYGEPEEVTYDIYPLFDNKDGGEAHVASMFIGAGKICQSRVVKKGDYYRLYCSVWAVTKSIRTHHNYVIYSDDFGQSWHVLGGVGNDANPNQPGPAFGGNEPKCEELPDGTVVLSSRKGGGRYFNLFTFADNTYTTGSWGTCVSSNDIAGGLSFGGNSTNGEIYKVKAIHEESGRICDLMFQSIPTGSGRDNVAIYYKEMEYNADGTNKYTPTTFAQGWTKGIHVSTKGSCYSTMISQADGRIAFFFEEEPSGYCMVYIPYSIEELTGGAYSLYTVNSTIGSYGIGTFYASEAMKIPAGVKAYVATEMPHINGDENASGYLRLTELNAIIPAKTGVVLKGEAMTYNFIPSISYGTPVENNMLVGYEADNAYPESCREVSLAEGYTTYVLTDKLSDNCVVPVGFYKKEIAFNVYNNKAYLAVPGGAVAVIYLDDEDDASGILETENGKVKTEIYDLSGRRVQKAQKGVYIVNGKKVVVK